MTTCASGRGGDVSSRLPAGRSRRWQTNIVTPEKRSNSARRCFFDPRIVGLRGLLVQFRATNLRPPAATTTCRSPSGMGWQRGPPGGGGGQTRPTRPQFRVQRTRSSGTVVPPTSPNRPRGRCRPVSRWPTPPDNLLATLNSMPQYIEWFEDAFFPARTDPGQLRQLPPRRSRAYEATLYAAPFDAWLNRRDTPSPARKKARARGVV